MSRRFTELWDDFSVENLVLSPLSVLYALGWSAYLGIYRLGLKRPSEPHVPVVCVGNLRVGGMGKTPTALHVASVLQELGRRVVLSMSAYGSPAAQGAQVCPDGALTPKTWGDEPSLVRELHPDLPIIVGRRRVLAAQLCAASFPDHVLLLDDGFQHLPLRKHLSILLDPPEPRNALCMPAGPYREPRSARGRADLVIPGEFHLVRSKVRLWRFAGASTAGPQIGLESLRGLSVGVVCALGHPDGFLMALEERGAEVVDARLLRDHDPLLAGNLFEGLDPRLPIATTLKDWVKLRERDDLGDRTFCVMHYDVVIEPQSAFRTWLSRRLDEIHS